MLKFSIVTVSYNPGKKLLDTINSVMTQSYDNFEIIIKDGGSTDDSDKLVPYDDRIHYICEQDCGIYDAMNCALKYVNGDYTLFLNCGDVLYDKDVLDKTSRLILSKKTKDIFYGNVYITSRNGYVDYPDKVDKYFLFTHSICHQSMFFSKRIITHCVYDYINFKYAADLEYYIKAIYQLGAEIEHMDFTVVKYEGLGTSETTQHRKRILDEKETIMSRYLTAQEIKHIHLRKFLTLKWIKEKISCVNGFSNLYEKCATVFIKKRKN